MANADPKGMARLQKEGTFDLRAVSIHAPGAFLPGWPERQRMVAWHKFDSEHSSSVSKHSSAMCVFSVYYSPGLDNLRGGPGGPTRDFNDCKDRTEE
eukprot:scaffold60362_cov15-Tisochrysis_lutea.AAC.1